VVVEHPDKYVVDFLLFHNLTLSWLLAPFKAVGMLPLAERTGCLIGNA
jgi:hypothetical protein